MPLSGSESLFIAVGVLGFLVLVVSLLFGELLEFGDGFDIDFDGDVELDSGLDSPTPSWLNAKVLAASMVGFGAFGYVAAQVNPPLSLDWLAAAAGFFLVGFGALVFVVKPLAKQQSNSLLGRSSFVGSVGTISLSIPNHGVGQVIFTDKNGARAVQPAITTDGQAMPADTSVLIIDIAQDGVIVTPNTLQPEV